MNSFTNPSRRAFLKGSATGAAAVATSGFFIGNAEAATPKFRFGTFHADEFVDSRAAVKFAELVAEKSNGEIEIQVFPGGQLGHEKELAEGVQLGTVDMAVNSGTIAQWVPEWGINELPFMYNDHGQAIRALRGPIMDALAPKVEAAGFQILGSSRYTPRMMYCNRPLRNADDFAGLKIRVPEVPIFIETFGLLGATPTPISGSELYTAIQTGVVDGQDGGPDWVYSLKTFELLSHMMRTEHIITSATLIFSQAKWAGLSSDVQTVLKDAGEEIYQWHGEESARLIEGSIQRLADEGMEIVTDVDKDWMQGAVASIHGRFAEEHGLGDLVDAIRATA